MAGYSASDDEMDTEESESTRSMLLQISRMIGKSLGKKRKLSSAGHSSTTTTTTTTASDDEVWEKAGKLQKSLKRRPKLTTGSESVLVAVGDMKESRPGIVVRGKTPFVEIQAKKTDDYCTFVRKAAKKCRLVEQEGQVLSLFKLNGARVLNENVTIKGKQKPWTLGNYLLLMKKSPSNVKLGVGYFTLPTRDSESENEENPMSDSDDSDTGNKKEYFTGMDHGKTPAADQKSGYLTVRYVPAESGKYSLPVTRDTIWHDKKGKRLKDIGVYQPEQDGYQVASISIDGVAVLSPVTNYLRQMRGFVVEKPLTAPVDDEFYIAWQSPKSVVVSGFKESVPLYCVASVHGSCSYVWVHLDSESEERLKFASSAVIYVNRSGFFQCSVEHEGKSIKGNLINVDVEIQIMDDGDSFLSDTSTKSHRPIVAPPAVQAKNWISEKPMTVSHPGKMVVRSPTTPSSTSGSSDGLISRKTPSLLGESIGTATKVAGVYSVLEFTEADIKEATQDYSPDQQLGSGGFGVVYKAKLRGTNVAIKKLTEDGAIALAAGNVEIPESFSVGGQLQCEMQALSKCRHRNLVDLVGFCSNPPMLVYEYMEEGNLADRLFRITKARPALTWTERSRILKDVCRGLVWLHSSSPPRIHGDIKAVNILLDKHLVAKLGDFGFSQELPELVKGRTMVTAAVVAKSLGYSPPEMDSCRLSPKSDVYSYGIVALETFTGQEAYVKERTDQKLIEHLDEPRKSVEGYKAIADRKAGDIAPYLVLLYYRIIENCLLKHSRRVESQEVMKWWEGTNF